MNVKMKNISWLLIMTILLPALFINDMNSSSTGGSVDSGDERSEPETIEEISFCVINELKGPAKIIFGANEFKILGKESKEFKMQFSSLPSCIQKEPGPLGNFAYLATFLVQLRTEKIQYSSYLSQIRNKKYGVHNPIKIMNDNGRICVVPVPKF